MYTMLNVRHVSDAVSDVRRPFSAHVNRWEIFQVYRLATRSTRYKTRSAHMMTDNVQLESDTEMAAEMLVHMGRYR